MDDLGTREDTPLSESVTADYAGIVLVGPTGARTPTIAAKLREVSSSFQTVRVLTTCRAHTGHASAVSEHVDPADFDEQVTSKAVLLSTETRGDRYAVLRAPFEAVINRGKVPVLVLPPSVIDNLRTEAPGQPRRGLSFITVFVDAPDDVLDTALSSCRTRKRDGERERDRQYRATCLYNVKHLDNTTDIAELISDIWTFRHSGGVIPRRLILLMMRCGVLLEGGRPGNASGASYDLSLGDAYYSKGKIRVLTDKDPFIAIEPYDYAIVTSRETVALPRDVTGRFDLSVGLFCQGIVLSNGPQVDPGFRGKLLCLLFNTSNAPVYLKRTQHYATLEFHKLLEPTVPYAGKYQDKEELIYYLPPNTLQGGINELKSELERVRHGSQQLQTIFLATVTLILSVIALLLALR